MSKLIVVVPVGRRASGRAVLLGNDGRLRLAPFRVLATSGGSAATRHGNPGRDWRRPFGDTPTGSYVIAGALPPGAAARPDATTRSRLLGALVLAPVGGNALEALRAGRTRFLLHGGSPDSDGRLRSTFGGLRVSDPDLASLIGAINKANADADPVSSVEVEETSTPAWKEGPLDEVPSSRNPRRKGSRAATEPVPRSVRIALGFGAPGRPAKQRGPASIANPGRRAFVGLALFAFGALGFACSGTDGVGAGGVGGGDDGGGAGGGYDGGLDDVDGGTGTGTHSSTTGEGTTTTGTETTTTSEGTTTTGPSTTTTSEGTTTTSPGPTTTNEGTTTGTDTTTTSPGPTTTGTDGTNPGPTTTGTDTTTTGTDGTTTGTDGTTTGTDGTTTGTDGTTTGTDGTTTGTDGTTTGTDGTTTGTDGTTTGTDGTTGADFDFQKKRQRRRKPPGDEGSGT